MEVTVDSAELRQVAERVAAAGNALAAASTVARAGPVPTAPVVALALTAWCRAVDATATAVRTLGVSVTTALSSYVDVDDGVAARLSRAGEAR